MICGSPGTAVPTKRNGNMKKLTTKQGAELPATPWDIYPRPQMRRGSYVNLNGQWEFEVTRDKKRPEKYTKQILVPFCTESQLSGVDTHFPDGSYLWYRRKFARPMGCGRVLLHIGAADQIIKCYVNQKEVGYHIGGYTAMTFDITAALGAENVLELRVLDDLRTTTMPYGKQVLKRGGMWYTPVSGVWQTVWLECVPETYIERLVIENRGYGVRVTTVPEMEGTVSVHGLGQFPLGAEICPENPKLWSPEEPHLYEMTVCAGGDRVESYFAIRSLEIKEVKGVRRLCLNGKPYFFHGLLDQGYWPDGIYTPADPSCYAEDIAAMKALGFNTLRKHIKVEPEEFYYQCDRLGMIVFQDMVNNGDYDFLRDTALPTAGVQKLDDRKLHKDPTTRREFKRCMTQTVQQLYSHPCICYWTIFNEGWGQFDSDQVYEEFKKLDDTRFIDTTSGWFRRKKSDVESLHIYFGPWGKLKPADKPLVLSEFGGYTYPVKGHLFNPGKSYGYKTCKTLEDYGQALEKLYRERIIPAARQGLCAAIYTQVSDVEDEINGLLTYDRKVSKADEKTMQAIAEELKKAVK